MSTTTGAERNRHGPRKKMALRNAGKNWPMVCRSLDETPFVFECFTRSYERVGNSVSSARADSISSTPPSRRLRGGLKNGAASRLGHHLAISRIGICLAARNRAQHDQRLFSGHDGVRQGRVGRVMGQVLLAGEEAQEG